MRNKFKLKKGDEVIVLAGKDKGKVGKITKMKPFYDFWGKELFDLYDRTGTGKCDAESGVRNLTEDVCKKKARSADLFKMQKDQKKSRTWRTGISSSWLYTNDGWSK